VSTCFCMLELGSDVQQGIDFYIRHVSIEGQDGKRKREKGERATKRRKG